MEYNLSKLEPKHKNINDVLPRLNPCDVLLLDMRDSAAIRAKLYAWGYYSKKVRVLSELRLVIAITSLDIDKFCKKKAQADKKNYKKTLKAIDFKHIKMLSEMQAIDKYDTSEW